MQASEVQYQELHARVEMSLRGPNGTVRQWNKYVTLRQYCGHLLYHSGNRGYSVYRGAHGIGSRKWSVREPYDAPKISHPCPTIRALTIHRHRVPISQLDYASMLGHIHVMAIYYTHFLQSKDPIGKASSVLLTSTMHHYTTVQPSTEPQMKSRVLNHESHPRLVLNWHLPKAFHMN